MHTLNKILLLLIIATGSLSVQARIPNFSLDSIATWGRFPRFCVNTYRWGDKFFNSYDSTYVVGTGCKFNIKYRSELRTDFYNFQFSNTDRTRMTMMADPTVTGGFYLTYMAVSVGYDLNIGKYFGGQSTTSKLFNFQFNCALFAADLYYIKNDQGTKITRFGPARHTDKMRLDFSGLSNEVLGADLYYFFNHKHYSQAAAFAFSKIQRKSSGSFYAGLSFSRFSYFFDFSSLPAAMLEKIPLAEYNYLYRARNINYSFRLGYGYNIVLPHGWTIGISESPIMGVRRGVLLNLNDKRTSFALINRFKVSGVYNHNRWFIGMVFKMENNLVYDKRHTMVGSLINVEGSVGYRFNLW